jgi:hypothetical protein
VSNGQFRFKNIDEINQNKKEYLSKRENNNNLNQSPTNFTDQSVRELVSESSEPARMRSVWGEIRKMLIDYFSDGQHLDRAWFSKIKAEEDEQQKRISLIAPTNLIRDWVNNKYGHLIRRYCSMENYQLIGVSVSI